MKNFELKTLADFFESDDFENAFKKLKRADLDAREFFLRFSKPDDYLGEIARHCLDFFASGDFMAKNEKAKEKALFKFLRLLFENFYKSKNFNYHGFFSETKELTRFYKFLKGRIGQHCLLETEKAKNLNTEKAKIGLESKVVDFGNQTYAILLFCELAERVLKTQILDFCEPRFPINDESGIGRIVFNFEKLKTIYTATAPQQLALSFVV